MQKLKLHVRGDTMKQVKCDNPCCLGNDSDCPMNCFDCRILSDEAAAKYVLTCPSRREWGRVKKPSKPWASKKYFGRGD